MRVFIDTNIYRKIFEGHPSTEYFEKLEDLLQKEMFVLVLPKITRVETYRNIAEILKKEAETPKIILPPPSDFFKDEAIIKKLSQLGDSYNKEWEIEYKKLRDNNLETKKKMFKKLLASFSGLAVGYSESQELFQLAKERKTKVYPPGKNTDPLGDQLVWEILLKNCIDEDLIIVSADGDWQDLINKDSVKINPFLLQEWKEKTNKKISLIKDLKELIKIFEKDYEIPKEEVEKEKQIPFYRGYPYFLDKNSGTPSLINYPSVGTVTVVEPISPFTVSPLTTTVDSPRRLVCSNCGRPFSYYNPSSAIGSVALSVSQQVYCPHCGHPNIIG